MAQLRMLGDFAIDDEAVPVVLKIHPRSLGIDGRRQSERVEGIADTASPLDCAVMDFHAASYPAMLVYRRMEHDGEALAGFLAAMRTQERQPVDYVRFRVWASVADPARF